MTLGLPVFWAAIAGVGLQAAQGAIPLPIEGGLAMLAEGAIPVALLTLGVQLARTELVFGRYELLGSALRLIVSPLLAYGIATGLGLAGLDRQVVVLQAAMPVAVNSLIWVMELGGDRIRVARTIVLSTVLTLVLAEILPQAICSRYGLVLAAHTTYIIWSLMFLLAPIAWPLSWLLDKALGREVGTMYSRAEL